MSKITAGRARWKIQRRLGLELPGLGKAGALERRPYGPGIHGMKRQKRSDYTIRLMEKQKIIFHYGLREKQLVNYIKKMKKDSSRAWVDSLIITLERRLDNAVFRMNMAPSILASKQMISQAQVLVNGRKVTVPNYLLKKGDVITLTEKGYNSQNYKTAFENPRMATVPACYNIEIKGENQKIGTMIDLPLPEDIPFEFEARLVTEYYWKVKP